MLGQMTSTIVWCQLFLISITHVSKRLVKPLDGVLRCLVAAERGQVHGAEVEAEARVVVEALLLA